MIVVIYMLNHTTLTGDSSNLSGYDSSIVMRSPHISTEKRCFTVLHWFTVAFIIPFVCFWNVGDTFSDRWMSLILCVRLLRFL